MVLEMSASTALDPRPVPFLEWIEMIRPVLKPPIGNKLLFDGQMKVMVVAGPNVRQDFHIEEGEEIFYQIQGDMRLDIMECGKLRQVVIREGEMFLLPGRIPHSPQRFPNTIGLVLERERLKHEIDGLRWYTQDGKPLYEEWFYCFDLGVQLAPVVERFFASEEYKTGIPSHKFEEPKIKLDITTRPPAPINFRSLVDVPSSGRIQLFDSEFQVFLVHGNTGADDWQTHAGEVFLYQISGSSTVEFIAPSRTSPTTVTINKQDVLLLPQGTKRRVQGVADSVCLHAWNNAVAV